MYPNLERLSSQYSQISIERERNNRYAVSISVFGDDDGDLCHKTTGNSIHEALTNLDKIYVNALTVRI